MEYSLKTIDELKALSIAVEDFLSAYGIEDAEPGLTIKELIQGLSEERLEKTGMDRFQLLQHFEMFVVRFFSFQESAGFSIRSMTIKGGRDKSGEREKIDTTLHSGDVVCVVGPTGSGKSRFLEDIECLAQGDTPTKRTVLINGKPVAEEQRFSADRKLVAQLSQNMNFIMDLSVNDFLSMHAESRMVENIEETVSLIFATAIDLAGEPFTLKTPVTQLSGGQSRALMVADTAHLSPSPVILIDEIENAGVDRRKALNILIRKEKIVVMATHDPILALMAERRLVIRNGGVVKIVESTSSEQDKLQHLQRLDAILQGFREAIRNGAPLPDMETPLNPVSKRYPGCSAG